MCIFDSLGHIPVILAVLLFHSTLWLKAFDPLSTPTVSATMHRVTDGTDRQQEPIVLCAFSSDWIDLV